MRVASGDNRRMTQPTERFSTRAEAYERYRPRYPQALVGAVMRGLGLQPGDVVADVGAGTGIFSAMLLERGLEVVTVEPNADMRGSLEALRARWPGLRIAAGPAEATTLADASVDAVVAVQAFHWFDPQRTRRECERILRLPGRVALAWNVRERAATPFLKAYDDSLLAHAPEYPRMLPGPIDMKVIESFFAPRGCDAQVFTNPVEFDFESLEGLVRSTSYVPRPDEAGFAPMIATLRRVFDAHQRGRRVTMQYATRLFLGRIADGGAD